MIVRGGTFGPVATNTYVVADREGGSALIVDPAAGSSRWVAETIAALAVKPVAVLDTHGHWDHVVENHVWDSQGIPVWVGRGDEGWLAAPAPFNPALFGNPPPTPGVTPAAILEDGDTITCGDLVFQMIATPGHSPGLQVAYNAAQSNNGQLGLDISSSPWESGAPTSRAATTTTWSGRWRASSTSFPVTR